MRQLMTLTVAVSASLLMAACASSKGSTSMSDSSTGATATTAKRPTIKSDQQTASTTDTDRTAEIEAARRAEEQSRLEASTPPPPPPVDEPEPLREEALTLVEAQQPEATGQYHIIIGSFKVLENAQALATQAIEEHFLPSIMENDEGLYRVAIYTCQDEQTVRSKIAELRQSLPQYRDMWLLKQR